MDLSRALESVRRFYALILLFALAFVVLTVGGIALTPKEYTATARGFVSVSSPELRSPNVMTSGSLYILARMPSYAALGTSGQVLDAVRGSLQIGESAADLRSNLTSTAVVNTAFIEVDATDADPGRAQRIADATVTEVAKSVNDLEGGTVFVSLSDPAMRPDAPSNRNYLVSAILALAAGAVVGAGVALWLDRRRARAT